MWLSVRRFWLLLQVLTLGLSGVSARAWSQDLPTSATPTTLPSWQLPDAHVRSRKPLWTPAELDPTAAATVLTGEELRERHLSVTEALAAQTGVHVQQLSGFGAPALLQIRGSTTDQVDVYVDDVPFTSLDGAPFDLADVPVGQIGKMEVYRGMTPATLGSQAIGGTLRLTLREPEDVGGEVSGGVGSYGARQTEAAGGWHREGLRLSGGVRYLHADGDFPYRNDNATLYDTRDDTVRLRQNNALDRLGGTLGGTWALAKHWTLGGRWFGAGLHQGIPGPALFEAAHPWLERNRQTAALSLVGRDTWVDGDRLRVSLQGGWTGTDVNDAQGELGLPWQTHQALRTLGLQTVWQVPLGGPLALVTRLQAMTGDVQTTNQLTHADLPVATRQGLQAGVATPLTWESLGLTVVPSLSGEVQHSRRTSDTGFAQTVHGSVLDTQALWTTRLATSWQALPWLQARAAWTRGTRAATLVELYGNDGVILGNSALRPESAMTWDAGLAAKLEADKWALAAEVSGFAQQVDDLIQLAALTSHSARYENIAAARLLGVEAQVGARLGRSWRLAAQYTGLVTADDSGRAAYDGHVLPMRPRTRWTARVDWTRQTGPVQWRPFATTQWQSGHYLDAANLVAVPGHFLLGGGVRVEHKPWQLFAEVRMDNALDAQLVDLVGYPLPGRTVWLQVGWRMWRDGDAVAAAEEPADVAEVAR